MTKGAITSLLFLLLFNLTLKTADGEIASANDVFGRKNYGLSSDSSSKENNDDKMIRRIEKEMLLLNKSDDAARDKRALGILLQGFMEALGYTVTPIQLASLPNPSTAAQMPVGAAAAPPPPPPPPAGGMQSMRQMQAPMPPMMPNASASAPPRQRETLRFTGLLNFGNSENTTNLINHLAQYENIFHGNRTAPAAGAAPPAPAPATGPDIDPRYARPPLKEPLFVQIPLPIAPNLPPPQPPSPMPLDHNEFFSKDSSEEYSSSKDDQGRHGNFEEENDNSHHSEEFEYKHDNYHNPEERNYENQDPDESYERPKPKENRVEEYKNNKSQEKYTVENKELLHPSQVSEDGPGNGSQFNHATFVDEPNWKEDQDAKVYKIAAEQEARAEALAEQNVERDKQKEHDHEEQEEFHRSREKEIDDANEEREANYQKKPYYDEDDDEAEDSPEKESYKEDDDEETDEADEPDHEEKSSQRNEARTKLPEKPAKAKTYEDPDFYPATLPISYDREKSRQGETLRDSYGTSLEKPGGRVDERVAEYITMFKNPKTGVYDPERIHRFENSQFSFDHSDLFDGFNRIQKEYGSPENKYEEYEIDTDQMEHRSSDKDESDESKKSLLVDKPLQSSQCNCNKKKKLDVQLQESRSAERSVTRPPPSTSYEPYYSTAKYSFDPFEHNHGIIARLTSYETPTTVQFEDRYDLVHNQSRTTVNPTIPPDRLTTMSFLREAEAKEIQAWPAPFDYLYDNSEHKNVVYKKTPLLASSPAPFKATRPSCNHHMMPFGEHKNKVNLMFDDHANDKYKSDRDSSRKPSSQFSNNNAKPTEEIKTRVGYYSSLPTTQATIFDPRKRTSSQERSSTYRTSTKPTIIRPTRRPSLSDIITTRAERLRSTKSPAARQHRKSPKFLDKNVRPTEANHRESTIVKPTIKMKYSFPYGRSRGAKEDTANYVEKDGMLIIPEPTPYFYNEQFEEFTEEPQSNTERVKIKEYRNRIASVKVSELKQLHPEGSMQIFKYSRNL